MADGGVARFWREIPQRYNFIGNMCESCERVFFPPRESCPYCRRKSMGKMKETKLSGKGEIVTYTIIHVGPENFEEQVPYPIAIIKLEEGPQITAQIVDCPIDEVDSQRMLGHTYMLLAPRVNLSFLWESIPQDLDHHFVSGG